MFNLLNIIPGRKRKSDLATLRQVLNGEKYRFRSIKALKKAINTTDTGYLLGLLEEIGTRREYNNKNLFGLISRVGSQPTRRPQPAAYDGDDEDYDSDIDNDESDDND